MTFTLRKISLSVVCMCVMFSANAAKTEAGVITDVWGAVFSPPGTPYFPSMRNSYYRASYQPYSAGYYPGAQAPYRSRVSYRYSPRRGYRYRATYRYRPRFGFGAPYTYRSYYRYPVYNYPVSGTYYYYPTNACGVNAASRNAEGKLTPSPRTAEIPKTFSNKPASEKSEDTNGKTDREKQDSFKATRSDKKNEDDGEQKTFKIPSRNEQKKETVKPKKKEEDLFPLKKPAPAGKTKTETPKTKKKEKQEGPDFVSTESHVNLPSFDRKITWKAAQQKTRLVLKSFVKNEKLSRSKFVPTQNDGWKPQSQGTHIASK